MLPVFSFDRTEERGDERGGSKRSQQISKGLLTLARRLCERLTLPSETGAGVVAGAEVEALRATRANR